MTTIKDLAKELNRQPGTLARWANEICQTRDHKANSKLFPSTVEALRKKSARSRRLKRANSKLYRGGLQQSLKLDGDNQAVTAHDEPGGYTCGFWFEHLPPVYTEAAKRNTTNNASVLSLYRALEVAFDWATAPEGFEFWHAVQQAVKDKTPLPAFPAEEAPAVVEAQQETNKAAAVAIVPITPRFAAYCTLVGKTPAEALAAFAASIVDHATNEHSENFGG